MPAAPGDSAERLRRLTFDRSGPELRSIGLGLLEGCDARLAALLARPEPPTVAGFFRDLDRILLEARDVGSHASFVFNVHPDPEVRAAGRELSEASDRFFNAFRLNRTAYDRLGALDLTGADAVTRHVLDRLRKEMRRSGVEKDQALRERLKALSDAIDSIGNQFAEIIATHDRFLEVDAATDLAGLPEDYRKAHPPGPDGRVRLSTRYPDYAPVQAYADVEATRHRLMAEFMNRSYPENLPVLDDLLAKRHEFASLLGYPAFAALAVEDKMMATPENARKFLKEVAALLRGPSAKDLERVRARQLTEAPRSAALEMWDETYYRTKIRREEYGVDARALRAYLPYGPVRDGLFALCTELFGLSFTRAPPGEAWHPSVETYDVARHGTPIGRFYLDMVPRDGKFSHAACFTIRTGIDGVQTPVNALVCNFLDPNEPIEKARMEYRDVVVFFHEFGHLLHAMFSGRLPWTVAHQLEWDFVEAPSLLFEEWARDPSTLGRFAKDPDTGAPIPAALLARLEASEAFGRAPQWMRQVALSAISFALYDRDPKGLDTTDVYRRIWAEHLPTPALPPGFHPQAAWGHLVGYSACYYTYVWSLVIARDLLTPFRAKGSLTDPELARRYAEEILAPGGSRPAADSIRAFLGRPSDLSAFAAWIDESTRPAA